jgi:hypothetical protein
MSPDVAAQATPVVFEPAPGFVAPDVPTAAAADLPSLSPGGGSEYISTVDDSPFSPAHDAPDIATSQPDIIRGEIDVPVPEAVPIEISGDTSVWSALTDSLADRGIELSERGQESFAHAVQKILESSDFQGEFIEKGGTAISGVPWDRLPDGAMIHFDKLFENEEFTARLEKALSSSSYKTLGKEIAGMGGVSDFLGKVANAYGAR